MKALVGITCCSKPFGIFAMPNQAASETYVRAVDQVVGAVPVLLPANGDAPHLQTLLARIDGVVLTGSRSNVHPQFYGGPPHPEGTPEDPARDAFTLPLIRAAVGAGVPVLAICRGLQEMNVALGGTLHQRLQDMPGRIDHSAPLQRFPKVPVAKAHKVRLQAGGMLEGLAGATEIHVNSLHNQGIDRLAPGLAVEAVAPDGTIEGVRVMQIGGTAAPGFALGVQWHPEYDLADPVSMRIFRAFGDAVAAHAATRDRPVVGLASAAD